MKRKAQNIEHVHTSDTSSFEELEPAKDVVELLSDMLSTTSLQDSMGYTFPLSSKVIQFMLLRPTHSHIEVRPYFHLRVCGIPTFSRFCVLSM